MNSTKFLGVHITNNLSWIKDTPSLAKKAGVSVEKLVKRKLIELTGGTCESNDLD